MVGRSAKPGGQSQGSHLGSDQEPGVQGEPEPSAGATATLLWGPPNYWGATVLPRALLSEEQPFPAAMAPRWEGRGCCPSRSISRKGKKPGRSQRLPG